jgi:DNA-binding transcriptional MerR regulator
LVDLLQFIDRKKYDTDGNELLPPSYEKENPIEVLLGRRPDIEHIQLTCENTNTVLPYIDLVNEILEYYVVNDHTLNDFKGHNVEEITSAELLASPQFVNDQAYTTLKDQVYPFNLPFNQPLSALRLYYDYLKVPLHEAMEKLRVNDNIDIPVGEGQPPYAWREIYNEYLGISQEEYNVLTDSETKKLPVFFGEDEMEFNEFIEISFDGDDNKIYNAKIFSRKTGITYNELIELIKTQFINPNSDLIPKLEKLRISFADIKKYKEGDLSDAEFEKKIPEGLDRSIYGGDVKNWVKDENNFNKIMSLILLTVPEGAKTDCEFAKSELRYSLPYDNQNLLKEIDYWRLLRFIRLWRKLGWSIEETDKAITALYKAEFKPDATESIETRKQKLDDGFKDLLVKIAHVKRIKENLNLKRKNSLIKLLALWSNIDTHGNNSLYKQMFLQSSILKIDTVFDDNGYGEYLKNPNKKIKGHLLALEAAFNVTAEELSLILNDVDFDESSRLSLENVSRIYRYSFLAKALKLSIQEFITLKTMSGIDPFNEFEYVHPSTLKFIELVLLIKQSEFKINTLNYFLQHEDVTGKASPSKDSTLSLAKTLKDGLVKIEQDYMVEDDPTGEIAKSKMALVYENDVVARYPMII